MINLSSPVMSLSRVGRQVAGQLKNLGVETVYDLLFYFPNRYEDWSKIIKISDLKAGENATVRGKVEIIQNKRSRWRKTVLTEAVISDESGSLTVGWFHQPYLTEVLHAGDEVYLAGKVDDGRDGEWQMVSPVYEKSQGKTLHTARIVPIYPSTSRLSQKQIRFLIKQAMSAIKFLEEWLPPEILKNLKLMPLAQAISEIHFPASMTQAEEARRRFKFEELFMLQLLARIFRRDLEQSQAPKISFDEVLTKKFVSSLPFQLTDDQRRAAWEIIQDIGKTRPMNRLLEGEVGSGKTLVAALAILNVVKSGYQAVFMAPTEILAGQHYKTFCKLFDKFGITVVLLTGSHSVIASPDGHRDEAISLKDRGDRRGLRPRDDKISRSWIIKKITNGEVNIIIGTHALIQEKIKFSAKGGSASGGKNLGLAIIDEQHRFGVEQRKLLREKSGDELLPHLLSMTATPIPRTLSLAFYGDLDISIIKQLPKERRKIITHIVYGSQDVIASEAKQSRIKREIATSPRNCGAPRDDNTRWTRDQVYEFIRQEIKNNHRVFILCPLIDPSDKLGFKSVKTEYEVLQKEVFADIPLGMLHGRLKTKEREKLMEDFRAGRTPILLTTTVVEVGVDVSEATVMMIESAERFGLSQLHQLRGRVGRGEAQGYCFLMVGNPPQSPSASWQIKGGGKDGSLPFKKGELERDFYKSNASSLVRLQTFIDCQDGFALAERDLELRGPGEIWGTSQSGFPEFKIASIKDVEILKQARQAAQELVEKDYKLLSCPLVREKVDEFIAIARNG